MNTSLFVDEIIVGSNLYENVLIGKKSRVHYDFLRDPSCVSLPAVVFRHFLARKLAAKIIGF